MDEAIDDCMLSEDAPTCQVRLSASSLSLSSELATAAPKCLTASQYPSLNVGLVFRTALELICFWYTCMTLS